jgi:hypothetical protein
MGDQPIQPIDVTQTVVQESQVAHENAVVRDLIALINEQQK